MWSRAVLVCLKTCVARCRCRELAGLAERPLLLLHCRWRTSGQLSLLLRLGRQGFQPQLQSFLAAHPSLLWMSQVQAGMLAKAATTLADAADAEKVR